MSSSNRSTRRAKSQLRRRQIADQHRAERRRWLVEGLGERRMLSLGTQFQDDINHSPAGFGINFQDSGAFVSVGNLVYFAANTGGNTSTGLWKTDGTSAGTVLVANVTQGPGYMSSLTNVGGTIFFSAGPFDGSSEPSLWKSNGTSAGTMVVQSNVGGGLLESPRELTNVNGTLFFQADDGTNGTELWKSNGTSSGTMMVSDLYLGSGTDYPGGPLHANSSLPAALTNVN